LWLKILHISKNSKTYLKKLRTIFLFQMYNPPSPCGVRFSTPQGEPPFNEGGLGGFVERLRESNQRRTRIER
jgi:hypothetical protein